VSTRSRILCVVNARLGANLTERDLDGLRRLDDVLAVDSLALLELVMGLETEFAARFEPGVGRDLVLDLDALVIYLDRLTDH